MIANVALLAWPIIALALYLSMPAGRATIWTILAAFMLLPVGPEFNLPGIPPLDKSSIPSLTALLLAPVMARGNEFKWPRSVTINGLMLLWVLMPFATALANGDAIQGAVAIRPGLGFREGLSMAVGNVIEIIPFILGAGLLANEKGHRDIVRAFALAALIYSLPVLFEIRMSPLLQSKVYGIVGGGQYFAQQVRFGGFRATVFMGHGLIVSTFMAMGLVAVIGMWRMRAKLFGMPAALTILYMTAVLILNKSVGPIILIAALVPMLIMLRSRTFISATLVIATLIVTYPAVRSANLLPLDTIASTVRGYSADRAQSFEFRLQNEVLLLNRAMLKPYFGWGSFGRNRVVVITNTGETKGGSVTDGTWIITVGVFGWVGYIACFGLLSYPFWRAFRLRRLGVPVASLALLTMHLLNVIDLIPNSSLRPITWLIAGALASMSLVERRRQDGSRTGTAPAQSTRPAGAAPEPAVSLA